MFPRRENKRLSERLARYIFDTLSCADELVDSLEARDTVLAESPLCSRGRLSALLLLLPLLLALRNIFSCWHFRFFVLKQFLQYLEPPSASGRRLRSQRPISHCRCLPCVFFYLPWVFGTIIPHLGKNIVGFRKTHALVLRAGKRQINVHQCWGSNPASSGCKEENRSERPGVHICTSRGVYIFLMVLLLAGSQSKAGGFSYVGAPTAFPLCVALVTNWSGGARCLFLSAANAINAACAFFVRQQRLAISLGRSRKKRARNLANGHRPPNMLADLFFNQRCTYMQGVDLCCRLCGFSACDRVNVSGERWRLQPRICLDTQMLLSVLVAPTVDAACKPQSG